MVLTGNIPTSNSNQIKGFIMVGLLIALFILGMLLLFRTPEKEGYVDQAPLQFINQSSIDPVEKLSDLDVNNGFYITKRDANGKAIEKGQLPYGYYKIDDSNMAKIPNGYVVEKQGADSKIDYMTKIVLRSNSKLKVKAEFNKKIPPNGEIPDGYYKVDEQNMAILPPNSKPNIKNLRIIGTRQSPKLEKTYDVGYVTESEYYKKKYTLDAVGDQPVSINEITISRIGKRNEGQQTYYPTGDLVFPLPEEVYYSELTEADKLSNTWKPNTIQFLPYGKIPKTLQQNGTFLYGYIDNTNLITKDGSFKYSQDYRDISNNFDVTFHESAEDLAKKNDTGDDTFGAIPVLDKDGNLVTLPRTEIHGDITYYTPGAYTFGAGTYVPKYEDSVYLSRTSHLPTMAEYTNAFKEVGFCEADKKSPFEIENKCSALDKDVCGSTSCCVLLGGSKCVAGNENGPTQKANYGDLRVRNRDYYTHMGKCYGNCP